MKPCPYCGAPADECHEPTSMTATAWSVCAACAGLIVVVNGIIREPTEDELERMIGNRPLMEAQRIVRAARRRQGRL